jgi:hypothetical protein
MRDANLTKAGAEKSLGIASNKTYATPRMRDASRQNGWTLSWIAPL